MLARCGGLIGDTLMGGYYDPSAVLVGHNCPTCRANYAKLGWEDLVLTPDPFRAENMEGAQNNGEKA